MILGGADEDDPEGRKAFFLLDGLFEMTLTGSYKLDTEDVSDDKHRWEVRTHPKTSPGEMDASTHAAMAAVGTTPFGRFISLGLIDGSTMTLARRYIADDDPRAAWRGPRPRPCSTRCSATDRPRSRTSRPSFRGRRRREVARSVFRSPREIRYSVMIDMGMGGVPHKYTITIRVKSRP